MNARLRTPHNQLDRARRAILDGHPKLLEMRSRGSGAVVAFLVSLPATDEPPYVLTLREGLNFVGRLRRGWPARELVEQAHVARPADTQQRPILRPLDPPRESSVHDFSEEGAP